MLPDVIENQVIEIKDALIENGIKDGLHTATECVVDIGKSISGIFTGKFENISQVQTAIGSGGVIDTFSDLFSLDNGAYGKSILNNSSIKTFFSLEEENIKLLSQYSNISEKEKIEIKSLRRGLTFVGDEHILIKINASDFEKKIIEEKNN